MPSSKAAPSHDALLVPEDKRTVAKIPAECVVIDLDTMLGHSLLKGVRSAQRISLSLWRLRRPHTAAHGERRKAGDERVVSKLSIKTMFMFGGVLKS
ncbi:carboxy-terminal domain RNA polymerase II polypeptide A small phosphatase 2 [Pygocentrus nattereri]|uniref:carboxy-terminal domain RNA polymerase II polypeptide A small phosphatase 2 n=1 Tax=Pygocentrus nattereri TaxID=42514 RepID=UPI0018915512|nr:carboxy-terminal domain RNA polymerase II polypeptide A small phosphatase 2 [Pygocentrus nattereri]